jgi:hypothetical protein
MADIELKLYYQTKVRVSLDVLDELERLRLEPAAPAIVKQKADEAQISWNREFALAQAEYDAVRQGMSTLPSPPVQMRQRLSELSNAVEQQINRNKAATLALSAASTFIDMATKFKDLA